MRKRILYIAMLLVMQLALLPLFGVRVWLDSEEHARNVYRVSIQPTQENEERYEKSMLKHGAIEKTIEGTIKCLLGACEIVLSVVLVHQVRKLRQNHPHKRGESNG